MIKYLTIFISLLLSAANIHAQSVSINADGTTAHTSALLDVKSTLKGLLAPRMSKIQRKGIAAPAIGLLVFQNAPDSAGFYYYDGVKWNWMAAINGNADTLAWKRNGNAATDTSLNFIGTTDNMPLRFKLNNQWAGQWDVNKQNYFIGRGSGENTLAQDDGYGTHNIAIGDSSFFANDSGYSNVAIGWQALYSNTTGYDNVALGAFPLFYNTIGDANIGIGEKALLHNTEGSYNVAIGYAPLQNNTTGNFNIANGYNAMQFSTTSSYNVANGFRALQNNEGDYNIANGYNALRSNISGRHNIANGCTALDNNRTGSYNIAIGDSALKNNSDADYNIAVGSYSLNSNRTGMGNIAMGEKAMKDNVDGNYNVAVGYGSLSGNVAGTHNVGLGLFALSPNKDGANNIVIGNAAMGSFNYSNAGTSFNSYNIAIGRAALSQVNPTNAAANTSGKNNIGIGAFSLQVPVTGYNNTALGYNSEITGTNSDNSTALGANATAVGSNYVRLGNTGVTSIFSAIAFNTSDGRFKTNIQSNVPGLDFIMGLRPVTYHFEKEKYSRFIGEKQNEEYLLKLQNQDRENKVSTGFIAQEVEALAKKLNYDFDGLYKPQNDNDAYGLGYQQFVTPLIKAVQEQQQLILQQQQVIKQQQFLFNDVLKRLAALEKK